MIAGEVEGFDVAAGEHWLWHFLDIVMLEVQEADLVVPIESRHFFEFISGSLDNTHAMV